MVVAVAAIFAAAASGSSSTATEKKDTAGNSADGASTKGQADVVDDVTLGTCEKDEAGFGSVHVSVNNNSSKASDYVIEVKFESADGAKSYGTGTTFVSNLGAGQTKEEDVSTLEDLPDPDAKCEVSKVDRSESV